MPLNLAERGVIFKNGSIPTKAVLLLFFKNQQRQAWFLSPSAQAVFCPDRIFGREGRDF